MNPCKPYEDLLSAQLDEALTAQEQADLNAHLETCPHCRKYAQDLQTLHASLLAMAADPPDWMTGSIMEDLKEVPFSPAQPKQARKARRWAPLAFAAVLALVLLGGAPMLFGGSSSSDTAAAEGVEQSTADSASPGEASGVTEEIVTEKNENAKEDSSEDMAPKASAESSAALTQEAALAALEDQLAEEGRDLKLEPVGLSDDGGSWLFSAKDSAGEGVALFSVARDSGVIREMPAAETIPER